jgi:NADPH:quinone reductase-like Zn-dependent oxidoreductase
LVRDLGAERFISTGAGRPGPAAGGFDVVIDTVGGAVLDGSHGLLREGGRPVTLGAPLGRVVRCRAICEIWLFIPFRLQPRLML